MPDMSKQEFAQILELGYERQEIEVKGPGKWKTDRDLLCKVLRAILGMANHRDGGWIIVGVADSKGFLQSVGLSRDELATWKYDDIADQIALYADPTVDFDLQFLDHEGRQHVILYIHEFYDVPVLCKKDLQSSVNKNVLRRGACYIRPRGKPETVEVPNHHEMRELIDLAAEKRMRRMLAQMQRVGIDLASVAESADQILYDRQLEDIWR